MPKVIKEEEYHVPEATLKHGIAYIRRKFFDDFNTEKDHYDLDYVERIRVDDDLLGRYLWHQTGNEEKALEQLKGTAKWRKDVGAKDLKIGDLNQDILKACPVYPNKWDINGNPIVMLAVKRVHRDSETNLDKQKIITFWVEYVLKKFKGKKVTIFIDCSGVGISNMDVEIMVFVTTTLLTNYPNCLSYVIVYNMPIFFNVVWQVVKAVLPKLYRPKVKFVNKETVREFVKPECLPERMGGQVPDYYDYENLEK